MFKIEKNYENVAKTIRLPAPLAEKIDVLAVKNNISFNQLILQCIEYAFENMAEDETEDIQNSVTNH